MNKRPITLDATELTLISLGAGVQSSVMALLAARGEITPLPDGAIFADTGWEPKAVYEHLDWLETELPFPVHRVSNGNIRESILAGTNTTGGRFVAVPFFTKDGGMGKRQCTKEFKLDPIHKKVRELAGLKPRQRAPKDLQVSQWIGISTDEISRLKEAPQKWIEHRFPLVFDLRMNRADCTRWFERNYPGRVLPKSSCIGCPYHNDALWRHLRSSDPQAFADAVFVDERIRSTGTGSLRGMDQPQYMHRSRKPLGEVDFSTDADHGQQALPFLDECDGICGL